MRTHHLGIGSVAVVFALVACSSSSKPSGAVASGAPTGEALQIAIADEKFAPMDLSVPANQDVLIGIVNQDGESHDFAVRSQNLNTGTLARNAVATATVKVGTEPIDYVCTFHGDMKGRLVPRTG
ncbi:MAG TPA: cupredoxin domain-containing protein [Mycobacteriales bacterium]|jgi:plastocyanin|nr:cupredoxin domain-containing protein [Mycobacteriales bacterium]